MFSLFRSWGAKTKWIHLTLSGGGHGGSASLLGGAEHSGRLIDWGSAAVDGRVAVRGVLPGSAPCWSRWRSGRTPARFRCGAGLGTRIGSVLRIRPLPRRWPC